MLNLLNGFPYIQISKLTTFRSLNLKYFLRQLPDNASFEKVEGYIQG